MTSKFTNLNSFFEKTCATYKTKPCLCDVDGESFSYDQVFDRVSELSTVLAKSCIGPGEPIAIVAANSSHWVIAYFAIIRLGCVAVPILTDFCDQDIANIILETGARAVFTCQQNQERVLSICQEDILVLSFCSNNAGFAYEIRKPAIMKVDGDQYTPKTQGLYDSSQTASIIYTSGTSGHSKGVLLSHANLLANLESASKLIAIQSSWRFLSVLPLSHAYEFTIGLLLPLFNGASIHYLRKRPTPTLLQTACGAVAPHVVCMVPLLLEKIFKKKVQPVLTGNRICSALIKIPLLKRQILKFIGRKVIRLFGGNIKLFAIGGAALHFNTEEFLKMAELPYLVGYGLTEASPLVAGGPFGDSSISLGSVGKVIPDVEVTLVDIDKSSGVGEIQVRGANIMLGYFENSQLTRETITADGWLKTGDLGLFDCNMNLVITGRIKNVIVLSSGENIYPEELEDKLLSFLEIAETIVVVKKGRLEAVIVPDYEYIADKHGINESKIDSGGAQLVFNEIDSIRRAVNERVPAYAKILSVREHPQPLIKTPTHKVKRFLYTTDQE
nr:AMP-binding protein [Desulfobulbaceae bacterium]